MRQYDAGRASGMTQDELTALGREFLPELFATRNGVAVYNSSCAIMPGRLRCAGGGGGHSVGGGTDTARPKWRRWRAAARVRPAWRSAASRSAKDRLALWRYHGRGHPRRCPARTCGAAQSTTSA